eukprot:590912-Pyramimonas_sp.AAC.1
MSEEPAKKRLRALEKDDGVSEALCRHLSSSESFTYEPGMGDPVDTIAIIKYTDMLLDVRKALHPLNQMSQQAALKTFEDVANEKEKKWKLADQTSSWREGRGLMLRAALRHVQQNVLKIRRVGAQITIQVHGGALGLRIQGISPDTPRFQSRLPSNLPPPPSHHFALLVPLRFPPLPRLGARNQA